MTDDLIARLEAASEGSRKLDIALWEELKLIAPGAISGGTYELPHYTTSIDAALTLVPEGWILDELGDDAVGSPGAMQIIGATAQLSDGGSRKAQGQAPTRPLAACIAGLRARKL